MSSPCRPLTPEDEYHEALRERERVARVCAAGAAFARLVSEINRERGFVSWTREIAIAQEKIDEAVLWALKR